MIRDELPVHLYSPLHRSIHLLGSRLPRHFVPTCCVLLTAPLVYWPVSTYINPITSPFLHARLPKMIALALCQLTVLLVLLIFSSSYQFQMQRHKLVRYGCSLIQAACIFIHFAGKSLSRQPTLPRAYWQPHCLLESLGSYWKGHPAKL